MSIILNGVVSVYRKALSLIFNYQLMACAGTDGGYVTLFKKISNVWTVVKKNPLPNPDVAKTIAISPDKKIYILRFFKLRFY